MTPSECGTSGVVKEFRFLLYNHGKVAGEFTVAGHDLKDAKARMGAYAILYLSTDIIPRCVEAKKEREA